MKRFLAFILVTINFSFGIYAQNFDLVKATTFLDYFNNRNYEQAVIVGTDLVEEMEKASIEDEDFAAILTFMTTCHSQLGNYNEAIYYGTRAVELQRKIYGTEHPNYISSLEKLALDYHHLGNEYLFIILILETMKKQLNSKLKF